MSMDELEQPLERVREPLGEDDYRKLKAPESGVPNGDQLLKSLSKALRASLALRGASCICCALLSPRKPCWGGAGGDPSRATVTRGEKDAQSFALSFTGMRARMGFKHWNRVDGSKWAHCLQQWRGVLHFGQFPEKSVPLGKCVEQL